MSNTYKHNDTVYIDGIGYGVIDNPKMKNLCVPDSVVEKKSSIYFDPQLFNSDGSDSNKQKKIQILPLKSENQQEKKKQEQKKPEEQKNEAQKKEEVGGELKKEEQINIVRVKIQGTDAVAYVHDKIIRKYIIVPVKAMFARDIGTFNVKIEINKTIESLQKQIFEQLGLRYSNYSKIRLFITSPWLTEIKITSKLVSEIRINQNETIIITANHNFCFQSLPPVLKDNFVLINNNFSLIACGKTKEENQPIPLPPPTVTNSTSVQIQTQAPVQQPKEVVIAVPQKQQQQKKEGEQKKQPQSNQNKEIEKQAPQITVSQKQAPEAQKQVSPSNEQKEQVKLKQSQQPKNKQPQTPCFLYFYGDMNPLESGFKYWEIKFDKIPKEKKHLQIGISNQKNIYAFLPLLGQKIISEKKEESGLIVQGKQIVKQQYGVLCKEGQSIGVLVEFGKNKRCRLGFYKNNVGLGGCFTDIEGEIQPIFGLGREGQISLQTRVDAPMDSFRRRK